MGTSVTQMVTVSWGLSGGRGGTVRIPWLSAEVHDPSLYLTLLQSPTIEDLPHWLVVGNLSGHTCVLVPMGRVPLLPMGRVPLLAHGSGVLMVEGPWALKKKVAKAVVPSFFVEMEVTGCGALP